MYTRVRYVHRERALSLHLGVLKLYDIVKSYISVALAIDEAHAYGVGIGGNGGIDELLASVSLEYSATLSLQELLDGNLAYSSALIYHDEPSFFFILMYA